MKPYLAACLLVASAPLLAAPIDSGQSRIDFTLKQMDIPMQGQFKRIGGDVTLDPANAAQGRANLTIQIASISLPTADATAQTKQPAWFNATRFPTAQLITSSIKPLGGNRFQFSGKLTIKGTTRDVSAPFTLSRQGALSVVDGTLPVSRLAYKVGEGEWADTDTVADSVLIKFHIAYPSSK
ncbi:YceI family protein [Paludibacterium purpuratum]|uniref:Polyisoprenoid-binding protein YceI n=1 Tax=Paludibacterium purpuratum TaxID=1144873 RepID=A0A4R7B600_9NEIS|nr:YceI family protein [Paludibacterium purpuratum]TDR78474.1 polyisoprenoid-binding protein YceI [Paludibacterium purpuratum]